MLERKSLGMEIFLYTYFEYLKETDPNKDIYRGNEIKIFYCVLEKFFFFFLILEFLFCSFAIFG